MYDDFASVYDTLMDDFDYDEAVEALQRVFGICG